MGFRTQYELITPQTALLMNFMEMILVIIICRFGSKEKDKKSDYMIFLLMAMPLVSVVLIVVDMFLLAMGKYDHFNSGQFLRMEDVHYVRSIDSLLKVSILTFGGRFNELS